MLKYLFLLACLTGGAMADAIDTQTELYIVAGILGGACLLLTIASVYNSVTIIGLQSKVAVLQAAGNATIKAVVNAVENSPPPAKKVLPTNQNPIYDELDVHDERDPYESRPVREDPYRRQDSRGGYKMDRQQSRPQQDDRRPPSGYY